LVAAAAFGAGGALWWAAREPGVPTLPAVSVPDVAPAALLAAAFTDVSGRSHALGEFQGRILVVNFWATWCVPCREEMPAFSRLHERWQAKGVQFVGLARDETDKVARFSREVPISYPLWIGDENAADLSRRLGNRLGVLPHTVILGRDSRVLDSRVGPYSEKDLDEKLRLLTAFGA
jgi:thiol-disulfide isomerase/thioredoxin